MNIDKPTLQEAAAKAGITNEQVEKLWNNLEKTKQITIESKFDLANVLYYFGAMIVISALSWFLGLGWEFFGGRGICAIALAYIALFLFVGDYLWSKKNLKVPGGLFITIAVCLIPLAIYGFESWTGWWIVEEPGKYRDYYNWIKGGWFVMEVGTILGAIVALYFYRFPFLTAPLFFSVWFMSMDLTPLLFGANFVYTDLMWVSIWVGLATLIVAYIVDQRTKEDFAFWGYLFGMLAFWGGLSLLDTESEFKRFLYCLINIILILVSILLQRKVFLIFGGIGVFAYISSLFFRYFSDSILFPFVLSGFGIVIVFIGVLYHRHHVKIEQSIFDMLPKGIRDWLPKARK